MPILKTGLPRTLKLRILKDVWIEGKAAFWGDVWLVPVADALALIDAEQAERIVEEGVLEVREKIEVYAASRDDAPARLLSRIPERDRPPREPVRVPLNGHLLDVRQYEMRHR